MSPEEDEDAWALTDFEDEAAAGESPAACFDFAILFAFAVSCDFDCDSLGDCLALFCGGLLTGDAAFFACSAGCCFCFSFRFFADGVASLYDCLARVMSSGTTLASLAINLSTLTAALSSWVLVDGRFLFFETLLVPSRTGAVGIDHPGTSNVDIAPKEYTGARMRKRVCLRPCRG